MNSDYPEMLMQTPGERAVSVNVIQPQYTVKQGSRNLKIPLLDRSGIHFTSELIKEGIDHKRDRFILVTGDRGLGKSTLIWHGAKGVDPNFDASKVAFWLEEFDQIFNSNPQGNGEKRVYPQVVMDEAGYALYGPQWLQREQLVIAKELIVSRIKRQILWMAVPKRMQLNNQVRDMAHIWIHVSEPKEYLQGYAVVRLAPSLLQSEFASEKYWEPKYAFIFPEIVGPEWDAYETRKMEFVNKVTKDTAAGKGLKSTPGFDARNTLMKEYYKYRKVKNDAISMEDLGSMIGLTKSAVSKVLNP